MIYQGYGSAMALILALGVVGNILSVCTLLRFEHRKRPLTFLMLNMCVADLLVCVFGYTVAVAYNIEDYEASTDDFWRCAWLAFINCATGMAVIATLTAMSFISYKGVTTLQISSDETIDPHKIPKYLVGIWTYAVLIAIPPIFGWNEFVPLTSKVSCHPNWESKDPTSIAYIVMLVLGGFFLPLGSIIFFYIKMFMYMKTNEEAILNDQQQKQRLLVKRKTLRVIVAAVVAFFLSWTPYCFVGIASVFTGDPILQPAVSLVPELMAKASVIYNPIVYLLLNSRFRTSLKRLFRGNQVIPAGAGSANQGATGTSGTPQSGTKNIRVKVIGVRSPNHRDHPLGTFADTNPGFPEFKQRRMRGGHLIDIAMTH